MARVANDSLLLGKHGHIHAGDEIPETFVDALDQEHKTDFARLEELGLVDPPAAKKPAAPKPPAKKPRARKPAAKKPAKRAAKKPAAKPSK